MKGTRLDINWYLNWRKVPRREVYKYWPNLTDAHLDAFEAWYEKQPDGATWE